MVNIQVIMGSTRQGRFVEKPAKWILTLLQERRDVSSELIDLRDYPLPFFDEPVSPSTAPGKYTNDTAYTWLKKVSEADAYIIVTPEYNHGYPAVLKNALDYVYKEWNNKPVAFVSYGGSAGGARSVEQLREVAVELQMVPIRSGVHIPLYWTLLDSKGNLKTDEFTQTAQTMVDQLLWWAKILQKTRKEQ